MKLIAVLMAASISLALATPTMAATLFSQDFESGLGANESMTAASPGFGLTDSATLGNGSFAIGHTQGYVDGANNLTDFYTMTLDLTNVTDATLAFYYNVATES